MTTLESVLFDRVERGLGDLLLELYACAYCAGAGLPCDEAHSESMRSLIWLLAERHRVEVLRNEERGTRNDESGRRASDPSSFIVHPSSFEVDPPAMADELPGWLLSLSQQADVIEGPPVDGWPI